MVEPMNIFPEKGKKIPRTQNMVALAWPPREREVWEIFVKICDRDGHSASAEIREWVRQQVKKRSPGNPQTPLERYEDPSKPLAHKHQWHGHSDDFGIWYTCDVQGCKIISV